MFRAEAKNVEFNHHFKLLHHFSLHHYFLFIYFYSRTPYLFCELNRSLSVCLDASKCSRLGARLKSLT